MASVNVPQAVIVNHEGSKKKARIEAQVDTMMVEAEQTISALPATSVTWIPVMEQVLEFEVVESPGNKAGKMKARARAKAKEKPTTKAGWESGTPTPPPARKSQRARQPPAKFRYLVPRPLGQQALPPMAPSFVRPPSSNVIPPLPLPQNLMMPFPPIPVSTPPGSSTLPAPATAGAALHLSTFPSINDQVLQPSSTSALTPTLLIPRAQPAFAERRRRPVATKRVGRKKLPLSPSLEHAGVSQSSLSHSHCTTLAGTDLPSSAEAIDSETVLRGLGTPTCTGSSSMCATQVACGSSWPNAIQDPRSSLRSYVGSDIDRTFSPPVENGAVSAVHCRRSAGKPPLPPNSWFLADVLRNPPHPPPAVLKRSLADVPPPPTHESHPMVPPRASLNNRDLRFPKPNPFYSHFASSQGAQASSTSQSVPWLVPLQRDENQHRIPGSDFSGHSNGINIPGQTRSQQKRRMRQLKNGISKKFQDLMQGATVIQEPDSQRKGVTTVKKIVITEEQRTKLVNEMIEACRSDSKFRAKYLDAVKSLSYYGVLQTASYHLVAQGPNKSAQEVVDACKNHLPPTQEGSTSASIKFYRAVSKVHDEAGETMQKLPNLREAGSCSVTKRNDGAWVVTLPDEKKRKLNGETRPTNVS